MLTFLATFAVFVLVIFGMSLGWIIKRKASRAAVEVYLPSEWKKCAIVRNRAMREKNGWLASSNALFSLVCRVRQRRHPTIPTHTSQPSFVYCILIQ